MSAQCFHGNSHGAVYTDFVTVACGRVARRMVGFGAEAKGSPRHRSCGGHACPKHGDVRALTGIGFWYGMVYVVLGGGRGQQGILVTVCKVQGLQRVQQLDRWEHARVELRTWRATGGASPRLERSPNRNPNCRNYQSKLCNELGPITAEPGQCHAQGEWR